jgi:hypothetical protein
LSYGPPPWGIPAEWQAEEDQSGVQFLPHLKGQAIQQIKATRIGHLRVPRGELKTAGQLNFNILIICSRHWEKPSDR